jgi:hypothetical protein
MKKNGTRTKINPITAHKMLMIGDHDIYRPKVKLLDLPSNPCHSIRTVLRMLSLEQPNRF